MEFLDDLLLLIGGSLWFWLLLEALKPGIVSYYWNLSFHTVVFVIVCIGSVILQTYSVSDETTPTILKNSPVVMFAILLLGAIVLANTGSTILVVSAIAIIIGSVTMIIHTLDV